MKIIFLDIDGVMNSQSYFVSRTDKKVDLDETRFPLLKEIIDNTKAEIVLSSTWRILREDPTFLDYQCLVKMLDKYGMKIFDCTPLLGTRRDEEINQWLKNNKHLNIESFCVIDDDVYDLTKYRNFLVRTQWEEIGLTEENVKQAIYILNNEYKYEM